MNAAVPCSSTSLARAQSMTIDVAQANEVFDRFCSASTLKSILRSYRYLCEILRIKPGQFPQFYPRIKARLRSWKAQALWSKFDKRSSHKVYKGGKACSAQRVLVIGAGPCGLRYAIEAQLLGAKVVVMEKRDRFSRNNVLHLWPYNITDLRGLGAKKFYGKFCAGSIDHISIRQLQCILLKVSLLLGVEVFENVAFEDLITPVDSETGWKAQVSPPDHPLCQYEFDCLIGADGKRNTLHGFKRKEFRGKLAIAITVNFINKHTEAENQVEEISGVAFIFNQKFFNDMNEAKGISLENIVYYRDETHYFVMTAKKQSLINKGVIINNEVDTAKLLSPENINQEALFDYAREAADFATNYSLPHLEFAVNHYGKPDVAMFDFTSMFQAENSCRIVERKGHRLLIGLVGDSLLEPFWPTGTGCARGFFGGLDTCWLMRSLSLGKQTLLEALAERESIYRLLNQTTPENTCKDLPSYTVDPQTRYPTLNKKLVLPFQVTNLVDTDNPNLIEEELQQSNSSLSKQSDSAKKKRRRESHVSPDALLNWFQRQLQSYDCLQISDMTYSFQNGLALCAIIHRYRPELIEFQALDPSLAAENNQLAFDILENDLGISPVMTGKELATSKNPDKLTLISYLSQIYELFRKDIPAVKQPKLEASDDDLLDSQYRHNHPKSGRSGLRRKHNDSNKISIGQLVANDAAGKKKKRRSKENENNEVGSPNKENIEETLRMNRSAQKKRLQKLMERAELTTEARKKRDMQERKSIKKEERYKIIEEQFAGHRRKNHNESISKYREGKKPKDLKRAIGKLDKDDWNIKSIEEKMVIQQKPDGLNRDKVPKWSKAAFQDKFNIMKGKLDGSKEKDDKFADVDASLNKLQTKLREGSALDVGERGANKVAALAEELSTKDDVQNVLPERKESSSNLTHFGKGNGGSECCHFCDKRVYVVERMSAEGKFFHRSCFRCDYCNILLRLGSYVFHRDGPFGGKFFCLPHSTENALEKYRYRRKADELRDAENRRKEISSTTNSEWNRKESDDGRRNPLEYIDSLPARHKQRLIASDKRESTPERIEFEASVESEEEVPSIMDEDEWTDRNFGNSIVEDQADNDNSKGNDVDTSDDSLSDLETDTEDDDCDQDDPESRPLTANEARQLRDEWKKKYEPEISDDETSSNENDDDHSGDSSDTDSSDSDSQNDDCDYDGEYESSSDSSDFYDSEDEIDRLNRPPRPPLPLQKSVRTKHERRPVRNDINCCSTSDTSTEVGSEDLSSADDDISEDEFSSGTATECEFTDSEGRPNPFHKDLDEGRMIGPESPEAPLRIYKQHRIAPMTTNSKENSDSNKTSAMNALTYSAKLQYKTPNLSDRLKVEQQKSSKVIQDFSTRKALSLKKNWVNEATSNTNSKPKVDSTEVDNRLKSLMDRLSSQQKLLKPAEKPTTQMQHFLSSTQQQPKISVGNRSGFFSIKSSTVVSPPVINNSQTRLFNVPPVYRSLSTENKTNDSETHKSNQDDEKKQQDSNEPSQSHIGKKNLDPKIEIKPDQIEDVYKEGEKEIVLLKQEAEAINVDIVDSARLAVTESLGESGSSAKDDEYHSCDDEISSQPKVANEAVNNHLNETLSTSKFDTTDFMTPGSLESSSLKDSENFVQENSRVANASDLSPDIAKSNPLATSSPLDFKDIELIDENADESLREDDKFVQTTSDQVVNDDQITISPPPTLGEDDIYRIYSEKDPKERRARMNSAKEKEKSLIHDLILGKINTPRSSSGVRRSVRTLPSYAPPPPPPPQISDGKIGETSSPKLQEVARNKNSVAPVRNTIVSKLTLPPTDKQSTPEVKKQDISLPATPLTNPEQFGIPETKPMKELRPPRPVGRYETPLKRSVTVSPNPTSDMISPTGSTTSNDVEFMDGIISTDESVSKSFGSNNNNGKNNTAGGKKNFMKTISGIFSRSASVNALNRNSRSSGSESLQPQVPNNSKSTSNTASNSVTSSKELKAHQNFKFPKLNFARSSSVQRESNKTLLKEAPRAEISEIGSLSSLSCSTPKKEMPANLTRSVETLSFRTSHPSTPPVPLSRKITIAADSCIDFGADSLSENEENQSPDTSLNSFKGDHKFNQKEEQEIKSSSNKQSQLPPEILEKIMKRGGSKTAKRAARVAQVKRVRKAQEIQRQLEELDEQHKDLEERGIRTEKSLRGEIGDVINNESELMQAWFQLLSEKNVLVRREQELLVQAKHLELEDRSAKLEVELREHLMLDSRSPESVLREGEVLKELLDISEQREKLQSMLERDKERYQREDKDIEEQMVAKGIKLNQPSSRKLVD